MRTDRLRPKDRRSRPPSPLAARHVRTTLGAEGSSSPRSIAERFLDGLLREQRQGKNQAVKVLSLLGTYASKDLLAPLERAVRFAPIR